MKIYLVAGKLFKTKKGAKKYINDLYKKYVEIEGEDVAVSMADFILEHELTISKVDVGK